MTRMDPDYLDSTYFLPVYTHDGFPCKWNVTLSHKSLDQIPPVQHREHRGIETGFS